MRDPLPLMFAGVFADDLIDQTVRLRLGQEAGSVHAFSQEAKIYQVELVPPHIEALLFPPKLFVGNDLFFFIFGQFQILFGLIDRAARVQHVKDLVDLGDIGIDTAPLGKDPHLIQIGNDIIRAYHMVFVGVVHEDLQDQIGLQLLVRLFASAVLERIIFELSGYFVLFLCHRLFLLEFVFPIIANPPKGFPDFSCYRAENLCKLGMHQDLANNNHNFSICVDKGREVYDNSI